MLGHLVEPGLSVRYLADVLPQRFESPLVLGVPNEVRWTFQITPPPRARFTSLPQERIIDTPCFLYKRAYRKQGEVLSFEQSLEVRCERIPPAEYPAYRPKVDAFLQAIQQDAVVRLP